MANTNVSIEKVFPAPIVQVWRAWTIPNLILQWIGSDPEGKGISAEMTVQPGGYFQITFANADGTEFTCMGRYSEVIPLKKLAFSWAWKNEPGAESFVTVQFSEQKSDATRMYFEHSGLGNDSSHEYLIGWGRTFDKLTRMLS